MPKHVSPAAPSAEPSVWWDLPFIQNPRRSCVPVSALSALRFLEPRYKISLTNLRRAFHQTAWRGVHFYEAALALHKLGWSCHAYDPTQAGKSWKDPRYQQAKHLGLVSADYLPLRALQTTLENGHMVVCGVSYDLLHTAYKRKTANPHHAVALTGAGPEVMIYHENGWALQGDKGQAHIAVSHRLFARAYKATGQACLVIYGLEKNITPLSARLTDRRTHPKKRYAPAQRSAATPSDCHP